MFTGLCTTKYRCAVMAANYLILHMQQVSNDPLHGKTLEKIVTELVAYFGWEDLGQHIPIIVLMIIRAFNRALSFYAKPLGHVKR